LVEKQQRGDFLHTDDTTIGREQIRKENYGPSSARLGKSSAWLENMTNGKSQAFSQHLVQLIFSK